MGEVSREIYPVYPGTVLPDEPGHLGLAVPTGPAPLVRGPVIPAPPIQESGPAPGEHGTPSNWRRRMRTARSSACGPEKVMGVTGSARRDLRIRYVEPGSSPPATVSKLDDYRDL